ncbi:ABC transporter permease, partial [Streptomyces olivaceoviridis]
MPRIHLGDWVDSGVNWLVDHLSWLFDAIRAVLEGMYDGVDAVLAAPEPLLMAGILAVLAWWLRGLLAGVLAFAGFALVDSLDLWDRAMSTLALVLVATVIALVISVPLGIRAARSRAVGAAVRPVLDLLQTMPSMVLLIPAMLFFGLGTAAGVVATLIFALAPGVRMTELGIRQVDAELVAWARSTGTSWSTSGPATRSCST